MTKRKERDIWEFGDFQTSDDLAIKVVQLLQNLGFSPSYILEPTCGCGSFLVAAAATFPQVERLIGIDVNINYLAEASKRLGTISPIQVELQQGNFLRLIG